MCNLFQAKCCIECNFCYTSLMSPIEFQRIRKSLGFTQRQMAEAIGVKLRTVIAWENNQNTIPDWACKSARKMTSPSINPELSLDTFQRAQAAARSKEMTLDEWIADLIKQAVKVLIFAWFIAGLARWAMCGDPVEGAFLAACDVGRVAWFVGGLAVEIGGAVLAMILQ